MLLTLQICILALSRVLSLPVQDCESACMPVEVRSCVGRAVGACVSLLNEIDERRNGREAHSAQKALHQGVTGTGDGAGVMGGPPVLGTANLGGGFPLHGEISDNAEGVSLFVFCLLVLESAFFDDLQFIFYFMVMCCSFLIDGISKNLSRYSPCI